MVRSAHMIQDRYRHRHTVKMHGAHGSEESMFKASQREHKHKQIRLEEHARILKNKEMETERRKKANVAPFP